MLELNKYWIPKKLFRVNIEDICNGQYGVFVEKQLRIDIKINGKKVSMYFFSLFSEIFIIVPIIAKKLHGRNVTGIFQK